jgi:hypothetical protein
MCFIFFISNLLLLYIYLYLFVLFRVDSGVFAMMFLEHWHSPRSMIANLFKESDIPNITIKIANDMVFSHKNIGNKGLVTSFDHKVYFCVFFSSFILVCSIYFCILILFSLLIVLSGGSEQLNSLLIQMFEAFGCLLGINILFCLLCRN